MFHPVGHQHKEPKEQGNCTNKIYDILQNTSSKLNAQYIGMVKIVKQSLSFR